MKILFISRTEDYQSNVLFHGLKTLYGKDVYECSDYWYMFNNISETEKRALYGRGFTLFGLLPETLKNVLPTPILLQKIKTRYFDYIIYGSIWRNNHYFRLVKRIYPKEKIIFVDGEDATTINKFYLNKGVYFKRELEQNIPNVFPICFGIPQSKILEKVGEKTKRQAYIVPGELSTYIYDKEEPYYKDYAESYFGITKKKGGWDCLRHYEIMANGCIPYFIDLEKCPQETMCLFPKQLILETNRLFEEQCCDTEQLMVKSQEVLNYTRKHLTTQSIATYMLNIAAQVDTIEGRHYNLEGLYLQVKRILRRKKMMWRLNFTKWCFANLSFLPPVAYFKNKNATLKWMMDNDLVVKNAKKYQ
ncbi:hypothetical protein AGMMS4956_15010 [Bacteroidia bacterium]|nr:hypothetical protein AGMMS4956_15010 [Bacteroidia bacterium]